MPPFSDVQVHKSKRSLMAQCIRNAYFDKMVMPTLHGAAPLKVLLDVGLEKLQWDYVNNFVGK